MQQDAAIPHNYVYGTITEKLQKYADIKEQVTGI
jgi:hypothetical protein